MGHCKKTWYEKYRKKVNRTSVMYAHCSNMVVYIKSKCYPRPGMPYRNVIEDGGWGAYSLI